MAVQYPVALIGVDPGKTTGVAVYLVDSADTQARLSEVQQIIDPDIVAQELGTLGLHYDAKGYSVRYVIEQFDKRPGIANPDFTSLFVIKDINKLISQDYITWQTPSQAKNLIKPSANGKPDGLKRFGIYQKSFRHANDASRHVLVYLVEKMKHMPTIRKGWPQRG